MNHAHYRKYNDRSQNSSTYHKKDGTNIRAILNNERIKEIKESLEGINMTQGQRLMVKPDHPFHSGKVGKFEFMGGPNVDVVVICINESSSHKDMIAVGKDDVVVLRS